MSFSWINQQSLSYLHCPSSQWGRCLVNLPFAEDPTCTFLSIHSKSQLLVMVFFWYTLVWKKIGKSPHIHVHTYSMCPNCIKKREKNHFMQYDSTKKIASVWNLEANLQSPRNVNARHLEVTCWNCHRCWSTEYFHWIN